MTHVYLRSFVKNENSIRELVANATRIVDTFQEMHNKSGDPRGAFLTVPPDATA
jgi:hypothetical protein